MQLGISPDHCRTSDRKMTTRRGVVWMAALLGLMPIGNDSFSAKGTKQKVPQVNVQSAEEAGFGLGITVTRRLGTEFDFLLGWAERNSLYVAQYQIDDHAEIKNESKKEVVTGDHPIVGVGLTAANLDEGDQRDSILVWGEADGQLFYQVALNVLHGTHPNWDEAIKLSGDGRITNLNGVGAAVCDIDGNDKPDILIGWSDGEKGYYRFGYNHSPASADRWSDVKTVSITVSNSVRGIGVTCANTDEDYRPEIVFSWLDANSTWQQRIGRNLDADGDPAEWLAGLAPTRVPDNSINGHGLLATRFDNRAKMDLILAWHGTTGPELFWVGNPQLTPTYQPTKEDLETVGDEHTGFSKAAVNAQKAAGIQSPAMLISEVAPSVTGVTDKAALRTNIESALDLIEPPIAMSVKVEIADYLFQYYRTKKQYSN